MMNEEEVSGVTGEHGWIAVDLDGTLAHYDEWRGVDHVGVPIMPMLVRVKEWLAHGRDVRIFTARVCEAQGRDRLLARQTIEKWCERYIGRVLPITNEKDWAMIALWDDRAVQVETNTGVPIWDAAIHATAMEKAERQKLEQELAEAKMWQDKHYQSQVMWEQEAKDYKERLEAIAAAARDPKNQHDYLTNPLFHAVATIAMDAIPEDDPNDYQP